MERDSVAFRINDHCAKTVFADLLSFAQNLSAVHARGPHRFIEPAFDEQIDERSVRGRSIINAAAVTSNAQAARRVLFFVREQSIFHSAFGKFLHFFAENGGIEFDRAIEIQDRNVGPAKCVSGHNRNLLTDQAHPGQLFFRVNIFRWRKIFRMIQTPRGNVDLVRPAVGFVSERSATRAAESSKRAAVSFVATRFAGLPFEIGALHDDPGHGLRAGCATTVFTMAIRGDTRLSVHRESNFSTITTAANHRLFHYAEDVKNRAKDCRPGQYKIDNLS